MGERRDGSRDDDDDPIIELLASYNELNGSVVEELDEEPSPLEFMRYVARNTPFVVRRAASGWTACQTWNVEYLQHVLEHETVNVAVTPQGSGPTIPPLPFLQFLDLEFGIVADRKLGNRLSLATLTRPPISTKPVGWSSPSRGRRINGSSVSFST